MPHSSLLRADELIRLCVVLDGVFVCTAARGVVFHEAAGIDASALARRLTSITKPEILGFLG